MVVVPSSSSFRECCFLPLHCCVFSPFLPLPPSFGGAAILPLPLGLSSVWWCCLAFSSLGRGAVPLARFGLVLFFQGTSTTHKSRRKAARPKDGGGQAAPPRRRQTKDAPLKGRRRDHHSTELNLTSFNLTSLNFFF